MKKHNAIPARRKLQTALQAWIVLGLILSVFVSNQPANAVSDRMNAYVAELQQQPTPTPEVIALATQKAQNLLERMTPEERIGQLFMVTFNGSSIDPESEIVDLISNYYVGGVMLSAANDNFTDNEQTVQSAIELTRQIQTTRRNISSQSRPNPVTGENFNPVYVPMFIGISQEGDGYPYDQILSGLTQLPNQMALGATWDDGLARQIGTVSGQELSSLGINLILGPSLDVLESPHTDAANDLGTRVFGGDPFWVGKLGQAFVEGLHTGSAGRLAVIAKHFPGHGGSDRLPEEEVATVRKSLDQLLAFELTPFITVTGQAPTLEATADGLLTAHIRYQGFQGNIRATTRPVSFDPQALKLLLGLPAFTNWRNQGGLMVSDNLGSRAVRGFYDLTSQIFDMPRRVALNAFLAGNDLLYIGDFSTTELDSITSARRTLEFFAQKYHEDPAFAQRVDESVLRILALKYRLYGDFILDNVLVPANPLSPVGDESLVTFEVAQNAATLISPSQAELDDTIPDPPNQNDRMIIITDTRSASQCSQCAEQPLLDERALEQAILRLYGPQAGGQVTAANLISYSMAELEEMLVSPRLSTDIERSLNRANWIVFAMQDASLREPSYQTLSRFLSERPDLFQKKRLLVFAFNAPYFLDATNISKLTAYYGLYSKVQPFVDMAAYLLFQEQRAEGASPVSIPAISYDLNIALFPDASQVIPLLLDQPVQASENSSGTQEPTQSTVFRIGDIISLRTGVIVDQNGHPVPDGTPVEFTFSYTGESNPIRQLQVARDGVALTNFPIDRSGRLEIQAISEPARSELLFVDIPAPNSNELLTPTETPIPTPSVTPTPTTIPLVENITPISPPSKPGIGDWIMALLLSAGIAWLSYKYMSNAHSPNWGFRSALLVLIGGLAAYSYLALQLPGSQILLDQSIGRGVFLATVGGIGMGMLLTWSWLAIDKQS